MLSASYAISGDSRLKKWRACARKRVFPLKKHIQQAQMQSSRVPVRCLKVAVIAAAFTAAACSDNRSPYEAYVACDADIAAAEAPEDIMSCYTEKWRPWFQAKDEDGGDWFAEFKASRPRISRLHEEQLVDDKDQSILSIVGHTQTGQPAEIGVNMRREGRRWRIDHEEASARGAAGTDARPVRVTLGPAEGPEWYPGELAAAFTHGADGRCGLSIYHVFRFPDLAITSDCERLTSPGTYTLAELAPYSEKGAGQAPVKFFDHRHYSRRVEDGELTITTVKDGRVSGEIRFVAVSGSDEMTVAGQFFNIPLDL